MPEHERIAALFGILATVGAVFTLSACDCGGESVGSVDIGASDGAIEDAVGNDAGFEDTVSDGGVIDAGIETDGGGDAGDGGAVHPTVEILRDTWGVPHVYGSTAEAVMYGFGWAQAEDHLLLMSDFYLEANGLLSSAFAADDPVTPETETRAGLVRSDRTVRLFRIAADVVDLWDEADSGDDPAWIFSSRSLLTAFAAGVNAWVDGHRAALPTWVPRYTPQGVAALARFRSVGSQFAILAGKAAATGITSDLGFLPRGPGEWSGSNQFVLGPSRNDNGSVRLLASPHLPFHGHTIWYEAHLSGGGFDVAGVAFYGMPAIAMGHNRRAAFNMTNNGADNADLFTVALDPADPSRYVAGGTSEPFVFEQEDAGLAGGGTQTFRRAYATLGGFRCPVVDPIETTDFSDRTTVTAGCFTLAGDVLGMSQIVGMNLAEGVEAFRKAMSGVHLEKWNVVFGDADGHIFYVCGSRHPRRRPGVDWRAPIDASDPANHWQGILSFGELPQAQDPPSGFFQNCNNPPSWVTPTFGDPIDMGSYPPDLCWHGAGLAVRGQRMMALLGASTSHTMPGLEAISMDNHLLSAEWYVPALIAAEAVYGNDPGISDPAALDRAIAVLNGWDYEATADSTAAALYTLWAEAVSSAGVDVLSPPPATVPRDLAVAALNALARAALALEAAHGTAAVPYGSVHRIRRGSVDLPAGGSEGFLQALHLNSTKMEGDVGYAWGGTSYHMITELRPDGVTAVSVKPWGQSDDQGSPHFADLTVEYAAERHKPFWFDRADVEAHLESRTALTYEP